MHLHGLRDQRPGVYEVSLTFLWIRTICIPNQLQYPGEELFGTAFQCNQLQGTGEEQVGTAHVYWPKRPVHEVSLTFLSIAALSLCTFGPTHVTGVSSRINSCEQPRFYITKMLFIDLIWRPTYDLKNLLTDPKIQALVNVCSSSLRCGFLVHTIQ
jgi:hypothetical protein